MNQPKSCAQTTPKLAQLSSPTSPIPTALTCNGMSSTVQGEPLVTHRENRKTDRLSSKHLHGQQLGKDEDIINNAIARLEANDDIAASPSRGRAQPISQHTVHGIYENHVDHLRGEASIKQPQLQAQTINEVFYQERHDEAIKGPQAELPQERDCEGCHELNVRGEPQACLFVASLAASRTDFQLVESVTEHFKKWGPLLNVKVLKDWMQRPYSFVQFEHIEHAQKAMLEAQNTIVDGRHIRIEQARVNRTLFILRFRRAMMEQDLISVLEQYGPVEDVSIFHDFGSLGNRRYAFAKFAYRDDAIRAYMSLRSNSRWTVEWAPNLSCQDQIEKESVFIGQLNPDLVTEAALRNRFKVYGDIQHIHLVKRNKPGTNRPTAFAFIEFDDENSAKEAIEQENNSTFLRTTIRVQHREASEYRMQRQNAAIQATRSLNVPHLVGSPPIEISTQPLNPMEYYGTYQPYQSPGPGRITFPSTYYTYPSPRMPMAGMGFVPVPQLSTVYLQQSGGPLRPTMANDGQGYYQGFMTYSNNPKSTATEQHEPTRVSDHDHATYCQFPEGRYYPQTVPAQVYLYEQGSNPLATHNMQLNPAVPSFHPMRLGLSKPMGIPRLGMENVSSQPSYTPSSQVRQPDTVTSAIDHSPSQPRNAA